MNSRLGVTATADMCVLPGVLGCSFVALRTSSRCYVPFRYASASILDFRFRISDFLEQLMIFNLQFGFRHLFSGSYELFSKFSIRIPQSAFRNPHSAIVDPVARPSSSRSLRSVPQAGSQFRGL